MTHFLSLPTPTRLDSPFHRKASDYGTIASRRARPLLRPERPRQYVRTTRGQELSCQAFSTSHLVNELEPKPQHMIRGKLGSI